MKLKFIKKSLAMLLTAAIGVTGTFSFGTKVNAQESTSEKQIKNIIYMIPDGAGLPAYELTKAVKEAGGLTFAYEASGFNGTMVTSQNKKMHLEDYLMGVATTKSASSSATDSAAGGTALAVGSKTNNGYIGINKNYKPMASILELAEMEGKSTGVVVTCYQYDATPSAFLAHTENRSNYETIIEQMKYSGVNLMLGAGINYSSYTGGNKSDGIAAEGYTIVGTEKELMDAAGTATKDTKIWGTIQGNQHHLPYDWKYGKNYDGIDDTSKNTPTLAEMTEAAIEILSKNEEGFFLMVEGSKVDYGGHHGNTLEIVSEYIAFDEAFKVALDYAKNRTDTVVVSVADHNTGLTNTVSSSKINSAVEAMQKGNKYTDFEWSDGYAHTGADVGVFMYLPEGAEKLAELSSTKVSVDQAKNYKIDNTNVPHYLASLISDMSLEEVTNKLYVDVTDTGKYNNGTFTFSEKNASVKVNTDQAVVNNNTVDLEGQISVYVNGKVYVPKKLLDLIGTNVEIVDEKEIKGSGTKADPYIIANKENFLKFTNNMISGETYDGKYFKQTENIDMSNVAGYVGIGKNGTFAGTYDGQGHTITVNINSSTENGIAVFPYTTGTIMNLGTKGSITNNSSSESGCAGIVRSIRQKGVIVNCYSTVDLTSKKDAAGIAMTLQSSGTIQNCYYNGKIQTKNNYGIAWNQAGSVKNAYYKMEEGSTSLASGNVSGAEKTTFEADTLNSYQDGAVSDILSKEQLCKFVDVEGYEFAFEGSIAKLNKITYTYTDKNGNKITKEVENFTSDVTGYNVSIGEDMDSSKPVLLSGEALNTNGNEVVTETEVTINEYGFATGEIRVTTKVETNYYTTTETLSYAVNIAAPVNKVTEVPTVTVSPTVTETPEFTVTPTVTETPEFTVTPTVTETPEVTVTPTVTETPEFTVTPTVTETPEVTITPTVTEAPEFTVTPTVTEAPEVTITPTVTEAPEFTVTPTVTEAPKFTVTPTVTETPEVTITPTVTEAPEFTVTPTVTETPKVTVEPSIIVKPTITEAPSTTVVPTKPLVSVSGATVSKIKNKDYTGKSIKPSVTVKDKGILLKKGKDYTLTYKNNKKIGKATVIIKGIGAYKGQKKVTFKIVLKKPTIAYVKCKDNKVTLKWNKVKGATGYEIYRSTKKGSGYRKIATIKKGSKVTYKDNSKLKDNKAYYYKIRAVQKKYKSSYSKAVKGN